MSLSFTVPGTFDLAWFGERLREEHGYLGPDDQTFYPTTVLDDGQLIVSARTSTGTEIDERSRDAIQAVIDAHDGSPPSGVVAERQEEQTARERATTAIQTLEDAHANWGSLTSVQKDAALKLVVVVVAKLGRLVLRRFG